MSDKKIQQRGLGRGLSALMADIGDVSRSSGENIRRPDLSVPIEKVHPNAEQPRRSFEAEPLQELANSIAERGIIQPLIVRAHPDRADHFQIVAGERRWRAAQMAKLHEVPVILREFNDTEVLEVAIIENIQRADLNPVEEATGYNQLMNKFGHTQERLSEVLGKSRSHIANSVRLLNLPETVLGFLREGKLTAGHARALVTAEDPTALAKQVVEKNLSVRETEKLMKSPVSNIFSETGKPSRRSAQGPQKDADTLALEGDLYASLGMRISIDHDLGKESGKLTITYETLEDLDRLCALLSG